MAMNFTGVYVWWGELPELCLSQSEFASRFQLPAGTERDWEQARATVPDFAVVYVQVIGRHLRMMGEGRRIALG